MSRQLLDGGHEHRDITTLSPEQRNANEVKRVERSRLLY
jgi:hypothetical protein